MFRLYIKEEEIENSNNKLKFRLYIKTMLSYCLKCRKNTESKNPKVVRNKNRRIMLLSKYAVCKVKNQNFLKNKKLRYY